MADIYNNGFFVQAVLRPVGIAANHINVKGGQMSIGRLIGLDGRHVEKDEDTYHDYYLVSHQLVDRQKLPASQAFLLDNDRPFAHGPLYLSTFMSVLPNGKVRERQMFTTAQHSSILRKIEKEQMPVKFTIKTLGQVWGAFRPRVKSFTWQQGSTDELSLIQEAIKGKKKISRLPIARFMSPKSP